MARRKWVEKRIKISFSQTEIEKLEAYCEKHEREYSDVIRELVRNLKLEG